MFDRDLVQLDPPSCFVPPDPGPRQAASMLTGSNWSNLLIELVKAVLPNSHQGTQTHHQRVLLSCQNILVQWDQLDHANRHARFSGIGSSSKRLKAGTNSALQTLNQPLRRERLTTLRRATRSTSRHQRSRAGHAVCWHALRAGVCVPNTTADLNRCSVVLASGKGGVPPLPSTTKLSPGVLLQRGHARHAAHGLALSRCGSAYQAPPLYPVRCSLASVSGQGGLPPCPGTTRLSRGVRGSCGTRPLRQSYIKPHCPQCQPVSRKLLWCPAPLRALRVKATGFMQNCLGWVRSHSRRRFPAASAPYAPPAGSLVAVVALWHWSGALRSVLVSGLRPVMLCVPPPTLGGLPLRGFGPARHCPSAPQGGSLSPRGCPALPYF